MNLIQGDLRRNQPFARQPLRPFEAPNCVIYVILLDPSVTRDPAFMRSNPQYVQGMPCYYVGLTSLSVEERFHQHLTGRKNVSRIAHQYGRKLQMDLVTNSKPIRRSWAMRREKRLAAELRAGGSGVWQA